VPSPTPSIPAPEPSLSSTQNDADRLSRRELLTLMSAIMALTAAAIDLMLPAFDDIRSAFDLAEGSADTGKIVTVFFVGLAAAQIVWGPLADRFGRKAILYAGVSVYLLGAIGSALAPTFELLLASRFVWGVGAAGTRVVSAAIIRDRFVGDAMAKAMSRIMAVFVLVPILAPAIGTAVLEFLPWRGIFWVCVVWAAAVTLWSLRLRETLRPEERRPLSLRTTGAGFREVIRTPITAGYTVATVFLQSVFITYLASSEVLISEIFDRRDQFPLVFGGIAVLFGVASLVNGRAVGTLGIDRVVKLVMRALLPLCALLVASAVASNGVPEFWIFMPTLGLILAAFMFLLPNLESAAMAPVGHIAGTASALTGAIRIAAGAVLGTIMSGQIEESVTPFAVGVAVMCLSASGTVWVVRHRESQRQAAHRLVATRVESVVGEYPSGEVAGTIVGP
jgi:MFS transporter, DHA1 family, multidrug resistance protein